MNAPTPTPADVLAAFKALADADPAAAFHMRSDLLRVISEAAYPELVVGTVPDMREPIGSRRALLDPRTGDEVHRLTLIDIAERWTKAKGADHDAKTFRLVPSFLQDYDDLVYVNDQHEPVSIPDGWEPIYE